MSFLDQVVAFGKVVDVIKKYAPKGKPVMATGTFRIREYTDKAGVERKGYSFAVTEFELLPSTSSGSSNSSSSDSDEKLWS